VYASGGLLILINRQHVSKQVKVAVGKLLKKKEVLMKSTMWKGRGLPAVIALVCGIIIAGVSIAGAWNWEPQILPMQEKYYGKTYSEWAAKWWQWTIGTPADINPNLDNGDCTVGQKGPVWFLATTLGKNPGVERKCTIPLGIALFFPLINASYAAFVTDPPEQKTDAYLRSIIDCGIPEVLTAEIDGVSVKNLYQYYEHSPFFKVKVPYPNIYNVPEGLIPQDLLDPVVDQGYYLFVEPLPPGQHTIHWKATWTCPWQKDPFTEDITYDLRVGKKGH